MNLLRIYSSKTALIPLSGTNQRKMGIQYIFIANMAERRNPNLRRFIEATSHNKWLVLGLVTTGAISAAAGLRILMKHHSESKEEEYIQQVIERTIVESRRGIRTPPINNPAFMKLATKIITRLDHGQDGIRLDEFIKESRGLRVLGSRLLAARKDAGQTDSPDRVMMNLLRSYTQLERFSAVDIYMYLDHELREKMDKKGISADWVHNEEDRKMLKQFAGRIMGFSKSEARNPDGLILIREADQNGKTPVAAVSFLNVDHFDPSQEIGDNLEVLYKKSKTGIRQVKNHALIISNIIPANPHPNYLTSAILAVRDFAELFEAKEIWFRSQTKEQSVASEYFGRVYPGDWMKLRMNDAMSTPKILSLAKYV